MKRSASRAIGHALVLVLEHAAQSQALAERIGVRHQSPQAILLRDGQPVWHASHYQITAEALAKAVATPEADGK